MTRPYACEEQARLATNKIPLNARLLAVTRFDPKKHNEMAQRPASSRVRCSHLLGRIAYHRNERKRVANKGQNLPSFPVIDKLT